MTAVGHRAHGDDAVRAELPRPERRQRQAGVGDGLCARGNTHRSSTASRRTVTEVGTQGRATHAVAAAAAAGATNIRVASVTGLVAGQHRSPSATSRPRIVTVGHAGGQPARASTLAEPLARERRVPPAPRCATTGPGVSFTPALDRRRTR